MWVDGSKIWFTVKAWGNKAENVIDSIRKGTPVIVTGRLAEEPYVVTKIGEKGETITEQRNGLTVDNAVVAIDLSRGAAKYFRTEREPLEPLGAPAWVQSPMDSASFVPEVSDDGWGDGDFAALEEQLVAA